ncbi:MAG: GIY-YIG nuclease family protein [Candidatus Paceibacterota bacterium]|jgi:putative endonuclease
MKYFTYILECSDKTLYIGYTNNLEKRLINHNNSKCGAHYTKIRRPVSLKYYETFSISTEAKRREFELKKYSREDKISLIKKSNPKWKDLIIKQ